MGFPSPGFATVKGQAWRLLGNGVEVELRLQGKLRSRKDSLEITQTVARLRRTADHDEYRHQVVLSFAQLFPQHTQELRQKG